MPSKNTTIYLLRHAHSTANGAGVLAGRDGSVLLSVRGEKEAQLLAVALKNRKFSQVVSSPMVRCQLTIAPYLALSDQELQIDDRLNEMEYGNWSGRRLAQLSRKKLWSVIQNRPALVRFPEGESFLEMSARANQAVIDLASAQENLLVVSHGDVIKAIVASQLGLSIDHLQKFAVDPASITVLAISGGRTTLVRLNDTSHLAAMHSEQLITNGKSVKRGKKSKYVLGGGEGQQGAEKL